MATYREHLGKARQIFDTVECQYPRVYAVHSGVRLLIKAPCPSSASRAIMFSTHQRRGVVIGFPSSDISACR